LGPNGRVLAFDRDPRAIAAGEALAAEDSRLTMVHASYADMQRQLEVLGWQDGVDGVMLDLGVSSPQLDDAERGFSFRADGPLDMRMDDSTGETAAQWLARVEQSALARVLKVYGEERFAGRVARVICEARDAGALTTTGQLAEIIAGVIPKREPGKHPATRSFQAIRIAINRELDELDAGLTAAVSCLRQGGRMAVISFHSLEDRAVKQFIRQQARGDDYPPGLPITADKLHAKLRIVGKQVRASAAEVAANPRARSAVLRVAEHL
jgi:16S rRNA (cytosine1402-N4)-methyltransferase